MVEKSPEENKYQALKKDELVQLSKTTLQLLDIAKGDPPKDYTDLEDLTRGQLEKLVEISDMVAKFCIENTPT